MVIINLHILLKRLNIRDECFSTNSKNRRWCEVAYRLDLLSGVAHPGIEIRMLPRASRRIRDAAAEISGTEIETLIFKVHSAHGDGFRAGFSRRSFC